jgi:DNA-binding NtrC family response regulator
MNRTGGYLAFTKVGASVPWRQTLEVTVSVLKRLAAEDVDLLLTDFQMTGRNGVELIEAARTAKKDLPVILMTSNLHTSEQADEERRKEIPLLRKPFHADEVLRLVAAGLDKTDPGLTRGRVGIEFPAGGSLDHR